MMAIGPEHALAQLAASLVFADADPMPSSIFLYADASAATGAAPSGTPLATITLAQPCGTLAAGVLTLHPADAAGSMVLSTGVALAAQWLRGDGLLIAAGTVTDLAGAGDFKIGGAATAPGATSPTLYAGGLVLLGDVVLG